MHHLLTAHPAHQPPCLPSPRRDAFLAESPVLPPHKCWGKVGSKLEAGEGERILAAQIEDKVSSSTLHPLPEHLPPPPPVSAPAWSLWASHLALSVHLPPLKAALSDPELLLKPQGHRPLGPPLLTLASERIEAPPTSTLRVDSLGALPCQSSLSSCPLPWIKSRGRAGPGEELERGEAQVLTLNGSMDGETESASASKIRGCQEFPGGPMTRTLTAGGTVSIPGQGTKICKWCGQINKQNQGLPSAGEPCPRTTLSLDS